MVKKYISENKIPKLKPNVACIGYFDGVHIGHQKLIKETIKHAKKLNVKSSLICFDPDPLDIIYSIKNTHLLSYKNRINVIESFGIDQIIIIKFDEKFMNISPSSFIKNYLEKLNIQKLICGYDFTFGYKGKGNIKNLQKSKKFETIVINECKLYGKKVSTTRIKEELYKGNFKLVNRLLGWDYAIELVVSDCVKKGKKWLVEAKLKDTDCILPKDGMYAYGFEIKDGRVLLLGPIELEKHQILLTSFKAYE